LLHFLNNQTNIESDLFCKLKRKKKVDSPVKIQKTKTKIKDRSQR
jgi:hypothetical protein